MPNFLFFYVTYVQKSAVLCTYIIIKLYNKTTYKYIIYHIMILLYLYNDAWAPHCARNLAVRRARQCSSFFEANVGSSGVDI